MPVEEFGQGVRCAGAEGEFDRLTRGIAATYGNLPRLDSPLGGTMIRDGARRTGPRMMMRMSESVETSKWSARSVNSLLSIGSRESILSIGSVGSFCSIGSVGSAFSIGSIGSFASAGGILSALSVRSILSWRSRNGELAAKAR